MKRFQNVLVTLAVFGMCCPQLAWSATPTTSAPLVTDIALADGGMLNGKVVDAQGAGIGGVPVVVKSQNRNVAAVTTAPDGTFSIQGLSGGVYQIAAVNGHGVYRLWAAGTAPPIALTSATVYSQENPVDGKTVVYTQASDQTTGWSPKMLLTNPVFIAAVVATAIAVPVALANSNSNPKSS
ncbi:MAG: carboxypeptidase-like regulatory domain-containing protein [Planctomycetaceae bacterium]|nr:carboxypeptidase-like regulatory domain-containing protein [Planctomycetaceae bacterium]